MHFTLRERPRSETGYHRRHLPSLTRRYVLCQAQCQFGTANDRALRGTNHILEDADNLLRRINQIAHAAAGLRDTIEQYVIPIIRQTACDLRQTWDRRDLLRQPQS